MCYIMMVLIEIQYHPPVPVDQYPGISCHLITHHVQRIHCQCSSSPPPPPLSYFDQPMPPPMLPPAVWAAQLYYPPPMVYWAFAMPSQQPANIAQSSTLGNRVDYNTRLLDNFNSTCHNWQSKRSSSQHSIAGSSINGQSSLEDIEYRNSSVCHTPGKDHIFQCRLCSWMRLWIYPTWSSQYFESLWISPSQARA